MVFIDYVGVGAGVIILITLVVYGVVRGFKAFRKDRPPIDWVDVGVQVKQGVASVVIILICFALAALCVCALAAVGWVFVQLLKLVGLLP